MALEDILKGYERLSSVSQIAEQLAKDPTNPELFNSFLGYNIKYEGISQQDASLMGEQIRKDPIKLRELANIGLKSSKTNLVQKIDENYSQVISALSQDALTKLAMSMPDKKKAYLDVVKAVQEENYGAAQKAYAEVYAKSAVWKNFIESADAEFIQKYIQLYVARAQKDFMDKNLSNPVMKGGKQEKDKQGNLKYEIDPKKVSDYIATQLKSYKDDQKNDFYMTVGSLYAKQEAEKAKKAKK